MDIKRDYYTQALAQDPEEGFEPETKEKILAMLRRMDEEEQQRSLDAEKEKWFRGLERPVLAFAKALDLNVRMWISRDGCGNIQFETSYFELGRREWPEIHSFWMHLCGRGAMSIVLKEHSFAIEFRYALHQQS